VVCGLCEQEDKSLGPGGSAGSTSTDWHSVCENSCGECQCALHLQFSSSHLYWSPDSSPFLAGLGWTRAVTERILDSELEVPSSSPLSSHHSPVCKQQC